ncbi:hypothetical protein BU23DRAFT_585773 [Bimuria novae-zelandiae CBS 107.79]|uniref:Tc1-like transposase DDE domain-containing protein n=1 Tax=Bimuria novae-zelandiae CBS 107.79 TaxID=1447943 RepID=A0A6A5UI66_9PLEO|nr:hypothetical protein BU23DRAFT_585773 [Bimuria novae-zelandiae CBS 107.79]
MDTLGAIEFMEAMNIPHFKQDVFNHFKVSHRQGWAMISENSVDRRHHRADGEEHRGRPRKISDWHIKEMDRMIKEEGFEARKMTWLDLAFEVGLEGVDERTISRAMGNTMSYHKCIACKKKWCNKSTATARKAWAEVIKERYPLPKDWYSVRFSDEVHWAIGPQGSIYIIRKPGERYCSNCIQHRDEKDDREKNLKRVHAWAAIGHDFKSDLTFYSIPSNNNGKMTQRAYIDQILKPVVKPWLQRGDKFVLEEDGDSGHGPGKSNIVRTWKQDNNLTSYFNCHSSPDFSPIENCWQPPKQYVKKFPHWDEGDTRELALEGWDKVTQKFINERVETMPQRLQDCINMDGQMTGW